MRMDNVVNMFGWLNNAQIMKDEVKAVLKEMKAGKATTDQWQ